MLQIFIAELSSIATRLIILPLNFPYIRKIRGIKQVVTPHNLLTLNKYKWEFSIPNIVVKENFAMCMKFSIISDSLVVSRKELFL